MLWNPACASCLIVPGKSLAIISRTGHVWHPMGRPRGLARSSNAPVESTPAAAADFAVVFINSLLDISRMATSSERLEFPAGPAVWANHFLRGIRIGYAQVLPVPAERLAGANRNVPQQQRFRNHARKFEIAPGLYFAALAGIQPFAFVSRRTRQRLGRLLEALHFRFRQKPRMRAVEPAKNFALVADEQKAFILLAAFALQGNIVRQFFGARGLEAAVIPRELHRRHIAARGKVVTHHGSKRIGLFITIRGTRFDLRRRFELQHPENRVEAVRPHVAQGAAT